MITRLEYIRAQRASHKWLVGSAFPFLFGAACVLVVVFPEEANPDLRSTAARYSMLTAGIALFGFSVWSFLKFLAYKPQLECAACKNWLTSCGDFVLRTGKCKRCLFQVISDPEACDASSELEDVKPTASSVIHAIQKIFGQLLGTLGSLLVSVAVYSVFVYESSKRDWGFAVFIFLLGFLFLVSAVPLVKPAVIKNWPPYRLPAVAGVVSGCFILISVICLVLGWRPGSSPISNLIRDVFIFCFVGSIVVAIVCVVTGLPLIFGFRKIRDAKRAKNIGVG